jgi:phosphoheptose isomerase
MNPHNIQQELPSHAQVLVQTVKQQAKIVGDLVDCFWQYCQRRNKLLLCGSGGNAADAQHVACEFVWHYLGGAIEDRLFSDRSP